MTAIDPPNRRLWTVAAAVGALALISSACGGGTSTEPDPGAAREVPEATAEEIDEDNGPTEAELAEEEALAAQIQSAEDCVTQAGDLFAVVRGLPVEALGPDAFELGRDAQLDEWEEQISSARTALTNGQYDEAYAIACPVAEALDAVL